MKLVIASDLHGSAEWTRALMRRVEAESPDRVALLGDLLYHGPRNALPEGHAPQEAACLLNEIAGSIVAVRGNCDAEVDQMMLDFPCMANYALVADGPRTLFLTHGHVPGMTPDDLSGLPTGTCAYLSGHTHVKRLEWAEAGSRDAGRILLVNPGSAALPKDGSHSYAIYEDGLFALKTFDGKTLTELSL